MQIATVSALDTETIAVFAMADIIIYILPNLSTPQSPYAANQIVSDNSVSVLT